MKREILFRGKRVDNGEWIYGNINYLSDGVFILENELCGNILIPEYHTVGLGCGLEDRCITDRYEAMQYGWNEAIERQLELLPCFVEIIPETIGQFTGLTDKNGVKIFEGDIVAKNRFGVWSVEYIQEVGKFIVYNQFNTERDFDLNDEGKSIVIMGDNKEFEPVVIGNIHDNPELLK